MTVSDSTKRRATYRPLNWSGRDWAVLLLLALLVALFFWRILTPNPADRASFPPGDFPHQFWAFTTFEARELSIGRLPLWNPYTYSGAPFWADIQSAVFYPISLLTLLVSGPWGFSLFALEVEAILHFWLAGTFTYLFVRRLTRHRGAALFAAIAFSFSGYLTGYPSQQLAVLETDVWLPLLLYFTDRALVNRSAETSQLRISLPDSMASGLVWGLALLAGHPQSAMFVFYTFALYVVFLIATHWHKRERASLTAHPVPASGLLLTPLAILLIGFGLSATAWLPGLEYMRLSVRAAGLYDTMSGGFPLYDPIQMLLPGSVSYYSPLYVGVLPLLLALWAALSVRRRETIFWSILAAGAFLLSFGGETFLYTPLYLLVPGFSVFRGQERLAFVVSFALAILAGYGFKYQISNIKVQIPKSQHLWLAGQDRQMANHKSPISAAANGKWQTTRLRSAVGWLLVGAIGLVILFFYGLNSVGWQDDSPFNLLLSRSVWLTILLAIILGAMSIRRQKLRIGNLEVTTPFLIATCFVAITILDLFSVNWQINVYPALPQTHTATPAVVQAIQEDASPDEVFRVYNEYRIYENYGVPYALEDTWGASPLRLTRYDEMHRSLRMERLWELLNVKYVITWREELYAPSEIIYRAADGDDVTYVHRLNTVAPRAWMVYQADPTADDATLARLDAFDFESEKTALIPIGTSLSLGNPAGEHGQVEIVSRAPGRLVLNVSTPADGLLVLSEIFYPGWRATVDNHPAPILQTDCVLRGVAVPQGSHRIELVFRPTTFVLGTAISATTLALLVTASLITWLRPKHRTAPNPTLRRG